MYSSSQTLAFLSLFAIPAAVFAQQDFTTANNVSSISGTWSSGNGAVETGENFANPVNFTFNVPATTGISFSFTDDGYFEEARYQFNSNGTEPHCIQAYMIFQHGTYTFNPNGSISTMPIAADGRIQVQDPCAYTTTVMTYYNEPGLYRNWAIVNDYNHGQLKLTLYGFDGAPLTPMFLKYNPPAMWPTIQLTTNESLQANAKLNGQDLSAAPLSASLSSSVLALLSGSLLVAAMAMAQA